MDRILSFYKDAKVLIGGGMVIPRMASIWISHACGLNCSYCGYADTHNGYLMAEPNFKGLVDDLKYQGVESIELSGGGEPTANPRCFVFAEYAYRKGFRVGMFTNGLKFDWERIYCFDYIRIGIDAGNKDSYSKIKGVKPSIFNKVVSNIERLIRSRGIGTTVGLKFVITENNYDDMLKFAEFAKGLGVDYVNFRKIFSRDNPTLAIKAKERLSDVKFAYKDFVYGSFDFEELELPCFMAPIHAVVAADGSLLNCCYFSDDKHIIGNVFKKGFRYEWSSRRHNDVLNSITPDQCNEHTCRWRYYNNRMRDVLRGKDFISFI